MQMNADLMYYVQSLDSNSIDNQRKEMLLALAKLIKQHGVNEIVFVCTHNSRRSQFAQVWMAVAVEYYKLKFKIYSAGTEATACFSETLNALQKAGFRLKGANDLNLAMRLLWNEGISYVIIFSKTLSKIEFTTQNFAAIMTCSDADKNCPIIPNASIRFPLTYKDPKEFDNTNQMSKAYEDTCRLIATELFYLCHKISEL
jgi:arsenate reductase